MGGIIHHTQHRAQGAACPSTRPRLCAESNVGELESGLHKAGVAPPPPPLDATSSGAAAHALEAETPEDAWSPSAVVPEGQAFEVRHSAPPLPALLLKFTFAVLCKPSFLPRACVWMFKACA